MEFLGGLSDAWEDGRDTKDKRRKRHSGKHPTWSFLEVCQMPGRMGETQKTRGERDIRGSIQHGVSWSFVRCLGRCRERHRRQGEKETFGEASNMEFLGVLSDAWEDGRDTEDKRRKRHSGKHPTWSFLEFCQMPGTMQGETQKTRGERDIRGSIQHGVSWRFVRCLGGWERHRRQEEKETFREASNMEFLGGLSDAWEDGRDTEDKRRKRHSGKHPTWSFLEVCQMPGRMQGETQKTRGERDIQGSIQHGVSWRFVRCLGRWERHKRQGEKETFREAFNMEFLGGLSDAWEDGRDTEDKRRKRHSGKHPTWSFLEVCQMPGRMQGETQKTRGERDIQGSIQHGVSWSFVRCLGGWERHRRQEEKETFGEASNMEFLGGLSDAWEDGRDTEDKRRKRHSGKHPTWSFLEVCQMPGRMGETQKSRGERDIRGSIQHGVSWSFVRCLGGWERHRRQEEKETFGEASNMEFLGGLSDAWEDGRDTEDKRRKRHSGKHPTWSFLEVCQMPGRMGETQKTRGERDIRGSIQHGVSWRFVRCLGRCRERHRRQEEKETFREASNMEFLGGLSDAWEDGRDTEDKGRKRHSGKHSTWSFLEVCQMPGRMQGETQKTRGERDIRGSIQHGVSQRFVRCLGRWERHRRQEEKETFREASNMEFLGGLSDAWDDGRDKEDKGRKRHSGKHPTWSFLEVCQMPGRMQGETQKTRGERDIRGSIQHGVSWRFVRCLGGWERHRRQEEKETFGEASNMEFLGVLSDAWEDGRDTEDKRRKRHSGKHPTWSFLEFCQMPGTMQGETQKTRGERDIQGSIQHGVSWRFVRCLGGWERHKRQGEKETFREAFNMEFLGVLSDAWEDGRDTEDKRRKRHSGKHPTWSFLEVCQMPGRMGETQKSRGERDIRGSIQHGVSWRFVRCLGGWERHRRQEEKETFGEASNMEFLGVLSDAWDDAGRDTEDKRRKRHSGKHPTWSFLEVCQMPGTMQGETQKTRGERDIRGSIQHGVSWRFVRCLGGWERHRRQEEKETFGEASNMEFLGGLSDAWDDAGRDTEDKRRKRHSGKHPTWSFLEVCQMPGRMGETQKTRGERDIQGSIQHGVSWRFVRCLGRCRERHRRQEEKETFGEASNMEFLGGLSDAWDDAGRDTEDKRRKRHSGKHPTWSFLEVCQMPGRMGETQKTRGERDIRGSIQHGVSWSFVRCLGGWERHRRQEEKETFGEASNMEFLGGLSDAWDDAGRDTEDKGRKRHSGKHPTWSFLEVCQMPGRMGETQKTRGERDIRGSIQHGVSWSFVRCLGRCRERHRRQEEKETFGEAFNMEFLGGLSDAWEDGRDTEDKRRKRHSGKHSTWSFLEFCQKPGRMGETQKTRGERDIQGSIQHGVSWRFVRCLGRCRERHRRQEEKETFGEAFNMEFLGGLSDAWEDGRDTEDKRRKRHSGKHPTWSFLEVCQMPGRMGETQKTRGERDIQGSIQHGVSWRFVRCLGGWERHRRQEEKETFGEASNMEFLGGLSDAWEDGRDTEDKRRKRHLGKHPTWSFLEVCQMPGRMGETQKTRGERDIRGSIQHGVSWRFVRCLGGWERHRRQEEKETFGEASNMEFLGGLSDAWEDGRDTEVKRRKRHSGKHSTWSFLEVCQMPGRMGETQKTRGERDIQGSIQHGVSWSFVRCLGGWERHRRQEEKETFREASNMEFLGGLSDAWEDGRDTEDKGRKRHSGKHSTWSFLEVCQMPGRMGQTQKTRGERDIQGSIQHGVSWRFVRCLGGWERHRRQGEKETFREAFNMEFLGGLSDAWEDGRDTEDKRRKRHSGKHSTWSFLEFCQMPGRMGETQKTRGERDIRGSIQHGVSWSFVRCLGRCRERHRRQEEKETFGEASNMEFLGVLSDAWEDGRDTEDKRRKRHSGKHPTWSFSEVCQMPGTMQGETQKTRGERDIQGSIQHGVSWRFVRCLGRWERHRRQEEKETFGEASNMEFLGGLSDAWEDGRDTEDKRRKRHSGKHPTWSFLEVCQMPGTMQGETQKTRGERDIRGSIQHGVSWRFVRCLGGWERHRRQEEKETFGEASNMEFLGVLSDAWEDGMRHRRQEEKETFGEASNMEFLGGLSDAWEDGMSHRRQEEKETFGEASNMEFLGGLSDAWEDGRDTEDKRRKRHSGKHPTWSFLEVCQMPGTMQGETQKTRGERDIQGSIQHGVSLSFVRCLGGWERHRRQEEKETFREASNMEFLGDLSDAWDDAGRDTEDKRRKRHSGKHPTWSFLEVCQMPGRMGETQKTRGERDIQGSIQHGVSWSFVRCLGRCRERHRRQEEKETFGEASNMEFLGVLSDAWEDGRYTEDKRRKRHLGKHPTWSFLEVCQMPGRMGETQKTRGERDIRGSIQHGVSWRFVRCLGGWERHRRQEEKETFGEASNMEFLGGLSDAWDDAGRDTEDKRRKRHSGKHPTWSFLEVCQMPGRMGETQKTRGERDIRGSIQHGVSWRFVRCLGGWERHRRQEEKETFGEASNMEFLGGLSDAWEDGRDTEDKRRKRHSGKHPTWSFLEVCQMPGRMQKVCIEGHRRQELKETLGEISNMENLESF